MVCQDSNFVNLIIFQSCVKLQVRFNPERPAQLDRDLVSRKLNSNYRPVFALNSQALYNILHWK